MGHFLNVAHRVLLEEGRPLTAIELTSIGSQKEYLKTTGKTPSQTMKSKLSTDILKKRERSLFMRTAEGRFGLREWKNTRHQEYVADRFARGLLEEDIVVFSAELLSNYIPGPGLHPITLANSEALLAECRVIEREVAERDFGVIQLISVFIVRYEQRYLTYKRTKRLPESRLHHYYSMAFGGHLNPPEIGIEGPVRSLFNIFRPDHGSWLLSRELEEEVRFERKPEIRYKGLLYDDSVDVSKQHLGIVYDVLLVDPRFEIGERGFLTDPKFESLDEIEKRAADFENWSRLILQYEKEQKRHPG